MNNSREQRPNITCESKLDVIEQRLVWTIDKYSVRSKEEGYGWQSSCFEFKGFDDVITKWELQLFPFGEDYSSHVAFRLYNVGSTTLNVFYEVSVRGSNDTKLHASTPPTGATSISSGYGSSAIQQFIKIGNNSNVLDCLVNDSLTVVCDITILGAETNSNAITAPDPASNFDEVKNLEQMSDDLLNSFKQRNKDSSDGLCDVIIKCEGREFYCHQFILSARSPVFEAMLKTKMKELESGSIAIDDFSKNVVEKMLVYIYGGMVPNIDKDAKELLNIAEKYQLQQMKISLGEKLVSILDNDNCIEYLAVGDLLHVKKLKDAALMYFKQNVNSIVNKENWKEGLNNLPAMLGWEIMEEVLKK